MEDVASDRGGKTSLKSRLVCDCVHFILTRNSYKMMDMLWASPNIFNWNNYGLVLNPRKSGAVAKRAQAEAAVASPSAASPDTEPETAARECYANTHARRVIEQAPEVGQSRK